jgi:hypothetical protein
LVFDSLYSFTELLFALGRDEPGQLLRVMTQLHSQFSIELNKIINQIK